MTPTTRYTLFVGHSVNGRPLWTPQTVEAAIAASWPSPGFTLSPAKGRWEGADEDATVVTYLGSEVEQQAVLDAAADIAAALNQDSILVTAEPVMVAFVAPARQSLQEVA